MPMIMHFIPIITPEIRLFNMFWEFMMRDISPSDKKTRGKKRAAYNRAF